MPCLRTTLTTEWGLQYPIVGAPMANVARGRMAAAVTDAGGLGMIGVGPKDSAAFVERESAIARGDGNPRKFGIGLMAWLLESRPELFEAALQQQPFVISISFGSLQPYADRVHRAGIVLSTQVNNRAAALQAAKSGADIIVAQGTEAGGHTGSVATLPLLQMVLDSVEQPVLAAGGIASPSGLAAVLAAGAAGAWIGTAFLLCPENDLPDPARERIAEADESDTILTSVFDRVNRLAWPRQFPGRALRNRFTAEWHGREEELLANPPEVARFREAADRRDYEITSIFAGQAVGLVSQRKTVAQLMAWLGDGAEQLLRARIAQLLG